MNAQMNIFAEGDALAPGTQLADGHFTISGLLYSGGFGMVYKAEDRDGTTVVIKECFSETHCMRDGFEVRANNSANRAPFHALRKEFLKEARVLASFDHDNIINIHRVFDENGTSYMVLDHIEGQDLFDVIQKPGALTPQQITDLLCKTLEALEYVHEQGYLHCDISPDNIMVREDMSPVLIDFGAARQIIPDDILAMPVMRAVKDGYSPQEFYVAAGQIAPCSDLYALAASIYEVITGDRPATAQDRLKAISRQKPDPYLPLVSKITNFPVEFSSVLDEALAAFPRKRVQSASDWLVRIAGERPEADMIAFPHAHTHSPKGTSIYRSLSE